MNTYEKFNAFVVERMKAVGWLPYPASGDANQALTQDAYVREFSAESDARVTIVATGLELLQTGNDDRLLVQLAAARVRAALTNRHRRGDHAESSSSIDRTATAKVTPSAGEKHPLLTAIEKLATNG